MSQHGDDSEAMRVWQWVAGFVLGFAVTLLVAQICLHYARKHYWQTDRLIQNEAFMNDAVAEAYAMHWRDKAVVIVGSSVTTQLPPEGKDIPHVYTIVQEGKGAMNGLEVIIRAGAAPRLVLAEADFIERGIDEQSIDDIFNPISFRARKVLPVLRYEYNLFNLVRKALIPSGTVNDEPKESVEQWQREQLPKLSAKIAALSRPSCIREEDRQQIFATLHCQLRELEKRGTRVVFFFDASFHPAIAATACVQKSRMAFAQSFGDHTILSASPSAMGISLYSPDGTHLFASSGLKYFEWLLHASGAGAYVDLPITATETQ